MELSLILLTVLIIIIIIITPVFFIILNKRRGRNTELKRQLHFLQIQENLNGIRELNTFDFDSVTSSNRTSIDKNQHALSLIDLKKELNVSIDFFMINDQPNSTKPSLIFRLFCWT